MKKGLTKAIVYDEFFLYSYLPNSSTTGKVRHKVNIAE